MKRSIASMVNKVELGPWSQSVVSVTLQCGMVFTQQAETTTLKPGDRVWVELVWGDDYNMTEAVF